MNCQKCGKPIYLKPPAKNLPNVPYWHFECQCNDKAKLGTYGWVFEVMK